MAVVLRLDDPELLDFMGDQEAQFLEKPEYFLDEVLQELSHDGSHFGDCLPWDKTTQQFRMRPGEVTIWGGVNGHGKSLVLGQVCVFLMEYSKVCIASLEMKPSRTITRMLKQSAGLKNPSEQYARQWAQATADRLVIYDQLDTLASDRILAMCHYASKKLNCKHVVIDSLMKCGIGKDDYEQQTRFIDKLCWVAKQYNIHIHLVHHMRKGSREADVPDKFDVRGAGELVDMVDNLVIVHRNKTKELLMEKKPEEVDPIIPDATLRVAKQRHAEWEGDISLYFEPHSNQYRSGPDSRAMRFNLEKAKAEKKKPMFELVEKRK